MAARSASSLAPLASGSRAVLAERLAYHYILKQRK
jgi:hypothetical protein